MIKQNLRWIFVDETGTSSLDDYSNKILGVGFMETSNPEHLSMILSEIKYEIWNGSKDNFKIIEYFHASNNPKIIKKIFYTKLDKRNLKDIKFRFNYINKIQNFEKILKTKLYISNFNHQKHQEFKKYIKYDWVIDSYIYLILEFIENNLYPDLQYNFVFSKIFNKKDSQKISKILLDRHSSLSKELKIFWIENKADNCSQLADYFTWSANRKICKNEDIGFSSIEKYDYKILELT